MNSNIKSILYPAALMVLLAGPATAKHNPPNPLFPFFLVDDMGPLFCSIPNGPN